MDTLHSADLQLPGEDEGWKKCTRIPPLYKILSVCFLLPTLMMTLVYLCLLVWPLGDHSVLVLDLNAQYVYYFEKLRNILVSGDSLLYSFERALGGEFMGIFAYYLSSPLSILVALLPKTLMTESMFLLLVIK
ncbi:MAG: YfhO family protein, partial [Clostridia bacterium]|nr:YfhO family protein [Clostridia bacterium]